MIRIAVNPKATYTFYAVIIFCDALLIGLNYFLTVNASTPMTITEQPLRFFLTQQIDLKNEANLAAWYSSMILLLAGLVALLNSHSAPRLPKLNWFYRNGWILMALVFIYLSVDEVSQVHENLATILDLRSQQSQGANYYVGAGDWIPILLPVISIVVVGMIIFFSLFFLSRKGPLLMACLGLVCWMGAIASEAVEGGFLKIQLSRNVEGLLEESCEIIGTTLLLIAFVEFFRSPVRKNSEETDQPVINSSLSSLPQPRQPASH
jgi:hypothetical protein